jgi:hypothetical protein
MTTICGQKPLAVDTTAFPRGPEGFLAAFKHAAQSAKLGLACRMRFDPKLGMTIVEVAIP